MCAFHSNTCTYYTHRNSSFLSVTLTLFYVFITFHSLPQLYTLSLSHSFSLFFGGYVCTTAYSSARVRIPEKKRRCREGEVEREREKNRLLEIYTIMNFYRNVYRCECLSVLSFYIFVIRYKQYICAIFVHMYTHIICVYTVYKINSYVYEWWKKQQQQ